MLIEIGEHMLEFCNFVSRFMRPKYYKILTTVFDRGELDLTQMSFDEGIQRNQKLLNTKKQLTAVY